MSSTTRRARWRGPGARVRIAARIAAWIAIAALCCGAAVGCIQTGYVVQAGLGQLRLWGKARPIAEVLDDPAVDARTKFLLAEVPRVLAFARDSGLDSHGSYDRFVELDGPAVVWFMAASKPLAFEPKVWSFPIVGSFTYLGWFDYREARQIRRYLEGGGWEVYVRPVRAFSTGGWFRDPVLSSMLSPGDNAVRSLVNVLLHELTHANILVDDQSTFNESVASFVGDTMAEEYLAARFGAGSPELAAFRAEKAASRERGQRLVRAYEELDALYASDATEAEKLAKKKRLLAALRDDLDLSQAPNNAMLLGFKTYNAGLGEFAALYAACDRSWPRFFAAVSSLTGDSFAEEQLEDIGPVVAGLTAAGCPGRARESARGADRAAVSGRSGRRARPLHGAGGELPGGLPRVPSPVF